MIMDDYQDQATWYELHVEEYGVYPSSNFVYVSDHDTREAAEDAFYAEFENTGRKFKILRRRGLA